MSLPPPFNTFRCWHSMKVSAYQRASSTRRQSQTPTPLISRHLYGWRTGYVALPIFIHSQRLSLMCIWDVCVGSAWWKGGRCNYVLRSRDMSLWFTWMSSTARDEKSQQYRNALLPLKIHKYACFYLLLPISVSITFWFLSPCLYGIMQSAFALRSPS